MDEKTDEVVEDEDDEVDDDYDEGEEEGEEGGAWVSRRKRPLRSPEAQVELEQDSKDSLGTESEAFSEEETEEEFEGQVESPITMGPAFLTWTPKEVADRIEMLGFPEYKEISRHVRQLLGIEEPRFSRSIALPYRDNMGLFLEQKSRTGKRSDALTYPKFIQDAQLQMYEPCSSIPEQVPSPNFSLSSK